MVHELEERRDELDPPLRARLQALASPAGAGSEEKTR
jgi:hypothetical protein